MEVSTGNHTILGDTHFRLISVRLSNGGSNVSLTGTSAVKLCGNDVVRRELAGVVGLSAEQVDVIAFSQMREIAWLGGDLGITFGGLTTGDGDCRRCDRRCADQLVFGDYICAYTGHGADSVNESHLYL